MEKSQLDLSTSYETKWKTKPFCFKDDKNAASPRDFESYKFKDGDSLLTIAGTLSRPWKEYTWQELARFNWGTSTQADINYYLEKCCGCKTATPDDKTYKLSATDTPGTIWIPRVRRAPSIRFRSPCKQDIGHVALDDESKQHINTLIIPPVYALHLELGDIDGLFDPLPSPIGATPWRLVGVQQRLQAIGCLYVPMGMSEARRQKAGEACWKYYKKVHTKPDPNDATRELVPTDDDLKTILIKEVRNNIVSIVGANHLTAKAQILRGGLPQSAADTGGGEESAMIRVPGGYRLSWPRPGLATTATAYFGAPNVADADRPYDYRMNDDRFACEGLFFSTNDLLGKIPIVATVWRRRLDGKWEPAEGVSVYLQLIDPIQPDRNPLRAPELRKIEMDYTKDWQRWELAYTTSPITLLSPATWDEVKRAALEARDENDAQEQEKIITRHAEAKFSWAHPNNRRNMKTDIRHAVQLCQNHKPPYTIENVGPKKFVDPLTAAPNTPEEARKDPQRFNCVDTYGGKRGLPVANNVFETGKARVGLHGTRDNAHADYGTCEPAQAVTPTGDDHKHAVKAVTNDKGHAVVMFMPSRIGGDTYKLRAYIGPPSLDFAGTDPAGPVMETGTLTVWRNLRLCGFYRRKVPYANHLLTASATVRALFQNTADCPVKTWPRAAAAVPVVNMDEPCLAAGATRALPRNNKWRAAGVENGDYRPTAVTYQSLADTFRMAYCELILDADRVSDMTPAQYTAAMTAARDWAKRSGEVAKDVDWNCLLLDDETAPWLLTVRSRSDYNANRDAAVAADPLAAGDMASVGSALDRHAMRGVGETLTDGGLLPGLTILHTHLLINTDLVWAGSNVGYEGIGLANGFAVLAGVWNDQAHYAFEYLAVHEGGHCFFHVHAPPDPVTDLTSNLVQAHQPHADCMCVMTYRGCYGDFCGRCNLMLRGWHTKRASYTGGA